jgi:hypothetical protein
VPIKSVDVDEIKNLWVTFVGRHEEECIAWCYRLERNGDLMKLGSDQRGDVHRSYPGKWLEPRIELSERVLQPSCKT